MFFEGEQGKWRLRGGTKGAGRGTFGYSRRMTPMTSATAFIAEYGSSNGS